MYVWTVKFLKLVSVAGLLVCVGDAANAQDPPQQFALTPGVMVDRTEGRIFVMEPPDEVNNDRPEIATAGVAALRVDNGELVWRNSAVVMPLEITSRKQFMCVARSEKDVANAIPLILLQADTGEVVRRLSVPLKSTIAFSPQETQSGNFSLSVETKDAEMLFRWQFRASNRLQALPQGTLDGVVATEPLIGAATPGPAENGQNVFRGAFRINLDSGEFQSLDDAERVNPPDVNRARDADVPPAKPIPNVDLPQFLSADGRHVIAKRRTKGAAHRYAMIVFDRETKKQIGEFPSDLAYIPFFVETSGDRSQIVMETPASFEKRGDAFVEVPRRAMSIDLETGKEIWSHPVAEREFRGQLPP